MEKKENMTEIAKKGLKELEILENVIFEQKKFYYSILENNKEAQLEKESLPLTQHIQSALNNYFATFNVSIKNEKKESTSQIKLKIINADTNESAIVDIIDLSWI